MPDTGTPDVSNFGTKIIYAKSLKTIQFTLLNTDITGDVITVNAGTPGSAPTVTKTATLTTPASGIFQVDYGVADFTQTELTTMDVHILRNVASGGERTIGAGKYEIRPSIQA